VAVVSDESLSSAAGSAARPLQPISLAEVGLKERSDLQGTITVRRLLLGSFLRRLRESMGITMGEAGYHIRAAQSKISRLETGRVSFKLRDIEDLLTLYGVSSDHERDQMLGLAREANTLSWWQSFGEVLPSWFEAYLGLESAASLVRTFEV